MSFPFRFDKYDRKGVTPFWKLISMLSFPEYIVSLMEKESISRTLIGVFNHHLCGISLKYPLRKGGSKAVTSSANTLCSLTDGDDKRLCDRLLESINLFSDAREPRRGERASRYDDDLCTMFNRTLMHGKDLPLTDRIRYMYFVFVVFASAIPSHIIFGLPYTPPENAEHGLPNVD